jgi:hypothetical protein
MKEQEGSRPRHQLLGWEMEASGGITRLTAVVDEIDDRYHVPSGS